MYGDRPLRTVRRAVSTGTHIYSSAPLRARLEEELGGARFEDLPVRLEVCAASIERAAEHWFTERADRAGHPRQRRRARPAPAGRGRRRALPRRRPGELHPGGPGGRARRHPRLRAPGRADRPAAAGADPAVGGRAGELRGGPPPPVHARHGDDPRRRRGPRPARRRHVVARRLAALPPRLLGACRPASTRRTSPRGTSSTRSSAAHEAPARVGPPSAGRGPGGGRPDGR